MRAAIGARTTRMLIAIVAVATPASAPAQEPVDNERYALRGELGGEYDSNAHRTEIVEAATNLPIQSSSLERFVLTGNLSDVVAPRHAIALSATAAAKIFNAAGARDESVAIAQTSAAWQVTTGPRSRLTLSGNYYEAFQRDPTNIMATNERRDFRSLAPNLQLGLGLRESLALAVSGGYRWLVFKPDRGINFDGPTAGIGLRWAHQPEEGADWEVGLGTALEYRRFGGPARVATCPAQPNPGLPCPGPDARVDTFSMSQLEITRTGRVLIGAGYAFHYNASNSYGDTVMRHYAGLRFAAALPFAFFLAARADLLFALYRDQITLSATMTGSRFASIDDENRSSVRVDLSRDVTDRVRLFARYTFYASELGNNSGSYARHTMLLSLAFLIEK